MTEVKANKRTNMFCSDYFEGMVENVATSHLAYISSEDRRPLLKKSLFTYSVYFVILKHKLERLNSQYRLSLLTNGIATGQWA